MFQVYSKACNQCLFTKERIVSASRAAEIIKQCKRDDSHFVCHKATLQGQDVCCREFYDRYSTNLIRVSQRMGFIRFVELPVEVKIGA